MISRSGRGDDGPMAKFICSNCGKQLQGDYPVCPYCKSPRNTQSTWTPKKIDERKEKSVLLLISAILGGLYAIYSIVYWLGAASGTSGAAAVGVGIVTVMVMPHVICAVLAAIFNILGWSMSSRGFALTGAILYAVAAVLFPLYAMFVIIQMILSFIGFAKLKKHDQ